MQLYSPRSLKGRFNALEARVHRGMNWGFAEAKCLRKAARFEGRIEALNDLNPVEPRFTGTISLWDVSQLAHLFRDAAEYSVNATPVSPAMVIWVGVNGDVAVQYGFDGQLVVNGSMSRDLVRLYAQAKNFIGRVEWL